MVSTKMLCLLANYDVCNKQNVYSSKHKCLLSKLRSFHHCLTRKSPGSTLMVSAKSDMFTIKLLWLHTQTEVTIGVVRQCYLFKLNVYASDHSKPCYVYFYH